MGLGLRGITWTVEGEDVQVEPGWQAVDGRRGYDSFRGAIAERDVRRGLDISQGAMVVGWKPDGRPLWGGRITERPARRDGRWIISAVGPKARLEKASGRRLYQSRDLSLWTEAAGDPHGYTVEEDKIEVDPRDGSLKWFIPHDTTMAANDNNGFVNWAKGDLITRIAGTLSGPIPAGGWQGRIMRSTGPNLAQSVDGANITGTGPFDRTLAIAVDCVGLDLIRTSAVGSGATNLFMLATDLRINGRATGDSMVGSVAIADLGSAVGLDTSRVTASTLNVLPLDVQDGRPWADACDYVALLEDAYWRGTLILVGGSVVEAIEYAPWSAAETMYLDAGMARTQQLDAQERFNRWVQPYQRVSGIEVDEEATAYVHELDSRGLTNTFPATPLIDVQGSSTLAAAVAAAGVEHAASLRYAGPIEVFECLTADGALRSAWDVRANQKAVEMDADSRTSRTHRIAQVTYSDSGVTAVVEDVIDTMRMQQLAGLDKARSLANIWSPRNRRRRRRRARRRAA